MLAVDATHFVVDAAFVRSLSNATIRLVPEQERGRVIGVRLFSVSATPYAKLGLENGDRIDGAPPVDPAAALARHLASGTRVVAVKVNRRGDPMTFHYKLQGP